MKWKKILSFAMVSVLVISGLAVISGHTTAQEGQRVTEINFGVQLDEEQGALNAADGLTHLFMQSLDGAVWQGLPDDVKANLDTWEVKGSYNNWFLNPAHEGYGTPEMQAAVDNGWIDDNESVEYLANNYDGEWTVNPLAHNDIRFAFQYLDRQSLVEDLILGWGNPRYGPMSATSALWEDWFVDSMENYYDLSAEGNWARVEDFVANGMDEIATYIEDTHPDMGQVTGNMDDGWMYNHPDQDEHQIEINIMARVEDWREDKGYWTASRLEDLGFAVNVDPTDSASAIPQAFFGTPEPYDNLAYHIYTGGWIGTAAVYFQEAAFSQMYMPWYGFVQVYGDSSHWQYDEEGYDNLVGPSSYVRDQLGIHDHENVTVAEMDADAQELYTATGLESEGDYWNSMINTAQRGFEESVRVFAVTQISLYPYNPDKLLAAVPESNNGYDTFFGPRTMRTDDGVLDTEILTGQDRPYMDNWNMEGGSADVYGEYQRRVAREYGSWMQPQTGLPMQVNNYWMNNTQLEEDKPARTHPYEINGGIEKDFYYNETGVLIENITIPETAVDWVPTEGQWKNRTWLYENDMLINGDNKSAVAVTIDPHLEHTWHDGTEMKFRDIMHYYARRKELGTDTGDGIYRTATADLLGPWWGSVDAIEWNVAEKTYTVYGDYTFPVDDKIGSYYSIYPWDTHPLTYTGWNQLHATDDYSYDSEEGTEWIHQLSTAHSNDMISALESMSVPVYLDEANMPDYMSDLAMSQSEMDTIVSSFDAFVSETGHSFIGCGPYRINSYDSSTHEMGITRWDDYGFPIENESVTYDGTTYEFPNGYWSEQFELDEIDIGLLEITPAEVEVYAGEDTVDVTGQVTYEELFPEPDSRALEAADYNDYFVRLAESERGASVKDIPMADVTLTDEGGYSSFQATLDVSDVDESGEYAVEIWFEAADGTMQTRAKRLTIAVEENYDLTINAGEGGTTDPEPGTYEYGVLSEVEVTAIPDEGYAFDEWTGDIPLLADEESETINITMGSNKEITANFVAVANYTLNVATDGNGTVEIDGAEVTVPYEEDYDVGASVTLTATPDEGWELDEWQGTDETGTEITITMDEDKDITAVFTEVEEEEEEEEEEDGGGIPGFTVMMLVLASVVAIAIYYNKKEQ
ncbi:MAG: hypothetical protein KGY66_01805 [Candidatus Thermoplasmatota archaeon]|nr:hypothetical protein [Candidatus Thermoplasmatota archaeon]MBS3789631.1 hypothetical protein [Candidatus Thermoplasmatota archaeon]